MGCEPGPDEVMEAIVLACSEREALRFLDQYTHGKEKFLKDVDGTGIKKGFFWRTLGYAVEIGVVTTQHHCNRILSAPILRAYD